MKLGEYIKKTRDDEFVRLEIEGSGETVAFTKDEIDPAYDEVDVVRVTKSGVYVLDAAQVKEIEDAHKER